MAIIRTATVMVLYLAVFGCHSVPPVASDRGPVSGKVTLDGRPLPGGSLTFILPSDPRYRVTAAIGSQGEFSVADAPLGEVQVTVETLSYNGMNPQTPFPVPPKYARAETSGLKIEVGLDHREGKVIELHSR